MCSRFIGVQWAKSLESTGGLDDLQGLSYDFRDIQMGLGDLVFYSMLTASMFFSFSIQRAAHA